MSSTAEWNSVLFSVFLSPSLILTLLWGIPSASKPSPIGGFNGSWEQCGEKVIKDMSFETAAVVWEMEEICLCDQVLVILFLIEQFIRCLW